MRIYLVQHGLAADKSVDPDRPLTEQGKQDIERIGQQLAGTNLSVASMLHSGKTRARQTAEILAQHLKATQINEIEGISPNDDVVPIINIMNNLGADTMVVGHLPFMQRCVSALLTGHGDLAIGYQPGSIVCLENNNKRWTL